MVEIMRHKRMGETKKKQIGKMRTKYTYHRAACNGGGGGYRQQFGR